MRYFLLIAASGLALTTAGAEAHRHEGAFYPHPGPGVRPWGFPPPMYRPAPLPFYPPPAYAPAPVWIPPRPVAPVIPPPVVRAVPVAPMAPAPPPPVFAPAAPVAPYVPATSDTPSRPIARDEAERGTTYAEAREPEHDGSWPGWLRMTVPAALVGGVGWYGLRRMKKHAGGPGAKPQEDFAELPY